MADLFDLGELPSWLQVPQIDTETATRVRRAANGWLQDATGLAEWPDPLPDRLWAWGIELAAIALRVPDGTSPESIDENREIIDIRRREEILAAARRAYNTGETSPQYAFPEPDWHWKSTPSLLQD